MFVILGAAGKVGRATIDVLRAAGRPVRAVLRDNSKAGPFAAAGCEIAIADLQDPSALTRAIAGASAVQVICPTAPKAADAKAEMECSITAIGLALGAARPPLVLAISDYGAEVESGTGVTMLFHALEARLRHVPAELILLRSAEHMENWSRVAVIAAETGRLQSLHHPLTKRFPTISASDLGGIAADLLLSHRAGGPSPRIVHAEGPQRYTPVEAAAAMSSLLGRKVVAHALEREKWDATLYGAGLSTSAARLITELYDAHNAGRIDAERGVGEIRYGTTELIHALKPSLAAAA
jgi:NAD(P)H dehydrogenase (quinone)